MENYIVSARKYRPMSFASVVGQQALTTTLKSAVTTGKLAHAYLFCGPRGVGKTTCARIFAKAINCLSPTADGEACNQCESCKAFNEQRSYNIFELDAASNNTVENIKALMDQTRIPPQVGRYKVFIIDEVHMLSTQAFNAFLKTLEEPPSYVVFILATTEKHKLLPTIISRCQIYDFERMSVAGTVAHLKMVAEKEGIDYEEEALTLIAEKADGGMRDALSMFDQAASFCQGQITLEKVMDDLNVPDPDNYFRLVDMALECKVSEAMLLLNDLIGRGFDAGRVINSLATHCRNVLMAKDETTIPLLECSQKQAERYKEQAVRCPVKFLYKVLEIARNCDVQYRQSSNKRLLAELSLIEMAQIQQDDDGASAGRSPKRLKILFQKLIKKQPKETTQQVVEAARPKPLVAHASQIAQPVVKPRIKLGSIGPSFRRLREAEEQPHVVEEVAETQVEQAAPLNQDIVIDKWMGMCGRMPEKYAALVQRMKTMHPLLVGDHEIEVKVENSILLEQLNGIAKRIRLTLVQDLGDSNLQLRFVQAEVEKARPKLSRRETFDQLCADNPAMKLLVTNLGLKME